MAGVEGTGMCVGNGSPIYEVLKTDKLSAWVLTDEKKQPTTACSASHQDRRSHKTKHTFRFLAEYSCL